MERLQGADKLYSVDVQTKIKNLFFPGKLAQFSPVSKWSPSVCAIDLLDGNRYIGKFYQPFECPIDLLQATQQWSEAIKQTPGICSIEFIPSATAEYFPPIEIDNVVYRVCLMPRIEYVPFIPRKIADYQEMGSAIGLLHHAALSVSWTTPRKFNFKDTNPEVEKFWPLQTTAEITMFQRILNTGEDGKLDNLPTQITHNDLHPENLLRRESSVLFLDLDQMLVGPRMNDLGQAVSAFRLDENLETFLQSVQQIATGYAEIMPISQEEIDSIPYFALRKLCISYIWFKGLASRPDELALRWYQTIRKRAEILAKHLDLV